MDKALLTNKKEMEKLYLERKMSCNEIRKQMHTTNMKVMQALVDLGIPIRTLSEEAKLRVPEGRWQGDDNPMKNPIFKKKAFENRDTHGEKNSMYGKKHSEESKAKMRAKKLKWYTPLYMQIRHSTRADQWSRDILKRDDYTCQECGKRGGYLEAHHIVGFKKLFEEFNIKSYDEAMNTPELWSLNNGIALCKECHRKTKNYGGRG